MKYRMRPLYWVASSKKDLQEMPEEVRDAFGYALYLAQIGEKHSHTKPLKGFRSAEVLEIAKNNHGDTYRAVYTVCFQDAIHVLHCFQKKSTKGIATPKPEMDKIRESLQ